MPISDLISSYLFRRGLRRWELLAERARAASPAQLKKLRKMAAAMSLRVGTVSQIVETRLRPGVPADPARFPPSTDRIFRPDVWAAPMRPVGRAVARSESRLGESTALYHDSKVPAVSVRQIEVFGNADSAPFGLQLDVYDFDGSFLSLVIEARADMVDGLSKRHILRLHADIDSEQPVELSVRLNLKNGPNTDQVLRQFANGQDGYACEFDLAYVPFIESRVEKIWFDLFFDHPYMNKMIVRDLSLSRHMRAEI